MNKSTIFKIVSSDWLTIYIPNLRKYETLTSTFNTSI